MEKKKSFKWFLNDYHLLQPQSVHDLNAENWSVKISKVDPCMEDMN